MCIIFSFNQLAFPLLLTPFMRHKKTMIQEKRSARLRSHLKLPMSPNSCRPSVMLSTYFSQNWLAED